MNNNKIIIFESIKINHSLYATIINLKTKQRNFVFNGLQIQYFYKKLPEYSKNVNIKKKLIYSTLFIKKELLSEISMFVILCFNFGQFKNGEFKSVIFQELDSNLSSVKNAVQKTIVSFYNPYLFSNKINRKQISNF